jgi:hypothetical protein
VAAWDAVSLALCLARFPWTQADVPAADGAAQVTVAGEGTRATIDPWPFGAERVRVRCDGRRLTGTFDDEAALRAALDAAPWLTLEFELAPAPSAGG